MTDMLSGQASSACSSAHSYIAGAEPSVDAVHRRLHSSGVVGLGEAYERGEWNAHKLDDLLHTILTSPRKKPSITVRLKMALWAVQHRLMNNQIGQRAFEIGERHYDLGNDLFKIMLDPGMSYTCGYWANASTLAEAQEAKLARLCDKMKLRPGQRVLDIGCGWGNFAQYAAKNYGACVTGITVSREQAAEATRKCAGLPVEIRLQDYRDVSEQFDHIVSIEMIEAVGRKNLSTYYQCVERCLKKNGVFALQAIHADSWSRTSDPVLDQYLLWIQRYIFPNGYLPNQVELASAGGTALRMQDWHCFGGDYERTLLNWADNFARGWGQIQSAYGEAFRRRWEFYLFGCAAAFRARHLNVAQIIYLKT